MGQGANLSSLWGAVIHGCVFYISKSDERKNESNTINAHNICLPAGRLARRALRTASLVTSKMKVH